jgi:hypothetical protein
MSSRIEVQIVIAVSSYSVAYDERFYEDGDEYLGFIKSVDFLGIVDSNVDFTVSLNFIPVSSILLRINTNNYK